MAVPLAGHFFGQSAKLITTLGTVDAEYREADQAALLFGETTQEVLDRAEVPRPIRSVDIDVAGTRERRLHG